MADEIKKIIVIEADIQDLEQDMQKIHNSMQTAIDDNVKLAAAGKETSKEYQNNSKYINDLIADLEKKNQRLAESKQRLDNARNSTDKHTDALKSNRKGVLESGGAMGLLGAATGGLAMDFKDAIEAVGDFGIKLKGVKGALIATGIGAIAIVLLELITNFSKWSGVIDGTTDSLAKLKKEQESQILISERIIESLETEIAIMQAKGEAIDNIRGKEKELYLEKLDLAASEVVTAEKELALLKEKQEAWALYTLGIIGGASSIKDWSAEIEEAEKKVESLKFALEKLGNQRIIDVEKDKALDREKAINAEKEKQLKLQSLIDKQLSKIEGNLNKIDATNKSINEEYGVFSGLSPEFYNIKKNLETQYSTVGLIYKTLLDINNINKSIKKNGANEENTTKLNKLKSTYKDLKEEWDSSALIIEDYTIKVRLLRKEKENSISENIDEANRLKGLSNEITNIANKILNFEKDLEETDTNSTFKFNETIARENELYVKKFELRNEDRDRSIKADEKEIANLKAKYDEIEELSNESFKAIAELAKNDPNYLNSDKYKEESLNITLFNEAQLDLMSQLTVKELEIKQAKSDAEVDIKQLTAEKERNIERETLDYHKTIIEERKALDDEYYSNLQTTSSNLQGFLNQLQDEQLIKQRWLRNTLLVAEKGLAIAGVVINTIKDNNKLKATVIQELANASASTAAYDIPGATLHTAAASSATAGIGLNSISAGISIASILGTTLTSWSKPSGSAGGGSAGAGTVATPQAKFNIVESSSNNQLAASIASNQNQPVKAYVVGSDMTTQQAIDRNKITQSTFL